MTSPVRRAAPVLRSPTLVNPERTAKQILGGPSLREAEPVYLRQGEVKAVSVAAQTVDITLGGQSVVIPGVPHNSNYRPTVGDIIWVKSFGNVLLVEDRIGPFGPSVIATAATDFVNTEESRTSSSYGNLSTSGPSVTVSVSPSGLLLVQVSAWIIMDTNTNGGAMGLELSGANVWSASDLEAEVHVIGLTNALGAASKVTLIEGLAPGSTTVTAKYRSTTNGSSVSFSLRHLWAIPL